MEKQYTVEELQAFKANFAANQVKLLLGLEQAIEAFLGDDGEDVGNYTQEEYVAALFRAREAFNGKMGLFALK